MRIAFVNSAITRFVEAHNRYLELDRLRTNCVTPAQRELMHIAILRAYLELQYFARVVTGLQRDDGIEFADAFPN